MPFSFFDRRKQSVLDEPRDSSHRRVRKIQNKHFSTRKAAAKSAACSEYVPTHLKPVGADARRSRRDSTRRLARGINPLSLS